ncbi:hypothetical protein ACFLQU_00945 [Verrucomicrobiota bacterium]
MNKTPQQALLDAIEDIEAMDAARKKAQKEKAEKRRLRRWRIYTEEDSERFLDACAKAMIVNDAHAHSNRRSILPYWGSERRWIIDDYLLRLSGGRKGIEERIEQGNLGIEDQLGEFTGDFILGLGMSGLLRQRPAPNSSYYRVRQDRRFMDALDATSIPHRFSTWHTGALYLSNCPLLLLPPEGNQERQLAGLLGGAEIVTLDQEEWLSVPSSREILALLDGWGIPFIEKKSHRKNRLLVSPFYGALLSVFMPDALAAEILALKHPAQCPLLSVVYYQRILSGPYRQFITHKNCLPFGMGRASFFRKGWKRRDIDRRGILELGVTHIPPEMRGIIVRWYAAFLEDKRSSPQEIRQKARKNAHS